MTEHSTRRAEFGRAARRAGGACAPDPARHLPCRAYTRGVAVGRGREGPSSSPVRCGEAGSGLCVSLKLNISPRGWRLVAAPGDGAAAFRAFALDYDSELVGAQRVARSERCVGIMVAAAPSVVKQDPLVPLGQDEAFARLEDDGREPQGPGLRGVGCTGKRPHPDSKKPMLKPAT